MDGVRNDPAGPAPPVGPAEQERALARAILDLLAATHVVPAGELGRVVSDAAAPLGLESVVVYLADYEQAGLVPVPSPAAAGRGLLRIDGTVGGRVFATLVPQHVDTGRPGQRRLWLPLLDGTERLGVLELTLPGGPPDAALLAILQRYAHLVAQTIVVKGAYGDTFELVRRRRPMTVAAELQYQLLPPSTIATAGFVLSAAMEPAYNAGGDSYDYAVDDAQVRLAVFDAMGHGLAAALTATVAISAYRSSRRQLLDLPGSYAAIDEAVVQEFGGERFATAVLAELDLDTGAFRWVSAGHPAPLLLRRGKLVKVLQARPSTPLGVPFGDIPAIADQEHLEPGDRILLYTDGLIEARGADGSFFTVQRLAEFLERQAAAGMPAPETLRRLRHAVMDYQDRRLQDDATAVLIEWGPQAERAVVPRLAVGEVPPG